MSGTIAIDPGVGEEPGDLAGAPDVLGPVRGAEAEVAVQPVAEVVAVEHVGEHAAADEHAARARRRSWTSRIRRAR